MEKLAEMRRRQGYSQRALAEKSGVSPSTIHELEHGHREPHPSTLRRLASALDVSVDELSTNEQEAKVEVEASWRDRDDRIFGERLRFTGKELDAYDAGGDWTFTLYECPGGYRVYEERDETCVLHPVAPNPYTGESEYTLYTAEEVAKEWPVFGATVGVFPVRDLD